MSIHGAKNLVEKSKKDVVVIDGKEYYSTLHIMDRPYIPPYNGEDMQKVAPKYKSQAYFEALEQQEKAAKSEPQSHVIVKKDGKEYENSLQFMNRSVPQPVKDRYVNEEEMSR